MLYNFPFFNFPRRYYYTPQTIYRNSPNTYKPNINNDNTETDDESKDTSLTNDNSQNRYYNDYKPMFEIFGIQLYFDDILLICLIFFLYTEGVQDEYLFIALILLLLS